MFGRAECIRKPSKYDVAIGFDAQVPSHEGNIVPQARRRKAFQGVRSERGCAFELGLGRAEDSAAGHHTIPNEEAKQCAGDVVRVAAVTQAIAWLFRKRFDRSSVDCRRVWGFLMKILL